MSSFKRHHAVGFLKELPQTLATLKWDFFPLLDMECLRLLPPGLETLGIGPLRKELSADFNLGTAIFSSEAVQCLPSNLTELRCRAPIQSLSRKMFPFLPASLTLLDISVPSPIAPTDSLALILPPRLITLHVNLSSAIQDVLDIDLLPSTLQHLYIKQYPHSFLGTYLSKLPRNLLTLSIAATLTVPPFAQISFPPLLTHLSLPMRNRVPYAQLPRTLTYFTELNPALDRPVAECSMIFLPATLTHLNLYAPHQLTREHLKHLTNLRNLELPDSTMSEELLDLDILPPMLTNLTVRFIRSTGRFLPDDLEIVARGDLIRSVGSRIQELKAQRAGLSISSQENIIETLTHCPANTVGFKDLSMENIPIGALPKTLETIHMPYHIREEDLPLLPPALTKLNATGTISFSALRRLDQSLKSVKRLNIVLDLEAKEFENSIRQDETISLPGTFIHIAKSFLPKIDFTVSWKAPITNDMLVVLPDSFTSLVVSEDAQFSKLDFSIFEILPTSLLHIHIRNSKFFEVFNEYLAHSDRFDGISSLSIDIPLAVPLLLPKFVTKLTIAEVLDASRLPKTWPSTLKHLVVYDKFPISQIKHLPPVTVLGLGRTDRKLKDLDMQDIPRSVTNLSLMNVQLSKTCLDYLPPSLTAISIPKAMFPAETILKVLKERREAASQ
jgi:hypothetical protein